MIAVNGFFRFTGTPSQSIKLLRFVWMSMEKMHRRRCVGNRPDDGTGFCSRRRHAVTRIVGLGRSKLSCFFAKKTNQAIEGSGFLGMVFFFTDYHG